MDADGQASYDAVFAANRAVTEAVAEMVRARYVNYRVRLVSPDDAWRHARADTERYVKETVSDAANLAWDRVNELTY